MKKLLITALLCFSFFLLKAQNGQLITKLVTKKGEVIKGYIQKVDSISLSINDENGKYYTFKATEIQKIKVKKAGKSIAKYAVIGTALGVGAGLFIVSIASQNKQVIPTIITIISFTTLYGAVTGAVIQLFNVKILLYINGNEDKFKANYKKLAQYITLY